MFRFKTSHLLLLLGLSAPVYSFAATNFCIETDHGFGHGGTTFIGSGFAVPGEGKCLPWVGFTKTASSVILTTTGTGCVSSDGTVLTVSVISADPSFFGTGNVDADYIRLTRKGSSGSFPSGEDSGTFGGAAAELTCSSSLLHLPASHD